jgi:hypothetical protein
MLATNAFTFGLWREITEIKMIEDRFKEQFIASFLGSWTAKHYEECCALGQHERLNRPPVEDAVYLSCAAWECLIQNTGITSDTKIQRTG